MPRRDRYHQAVIDALIADGWTITDDPLWIPFGDTNMYVDFGAEMPIGAEKSGRKIAVEVKSFVGRSEIRDLELALGQFNLYRDVLSESNSDRTLYLAVPERTYRGVFISPLGQMVLRRQRVHLIVFDDIKARIVQWLP